MRRFLLPLILLTPTHSWAGDPPAANDCGGKPASKLVSLQGSLSIDPDSKGHWQAAHLNDALCEGSRVKVDPYSRASLLLPNGVVLRLDEGTVMSLNGLAPEQTTLLDLAQGFVHFISRTPKHLKITSPIANAGPEGTEFAMSVDQDKAALWVYEGGVRFDNAQGNLHLKPGEGAQALAGQAPKAYLDIKPEDAVAWALYYPPLGAYTAGDGALADAVQAFRQGRVDSALQTLDGIAPAQQTNQFLTNRAAMNLFVGRSQAAQQDIQQLLAGNANNADALALQSVLALTQNRKDQAYDLANKAVSANPASPWAQSALSYAEQSRFELDKALQAADQAVKLAPGDALVWARKSELELALGKLGDSQQSAKTALKLDASLEKTHSVMGFAYLRTMDADDAIQVFEHAVQLDSTSPLARMGLGLAKIRKGRFVEGRQELEIAAILDPANSSIRSYVGKAYYEEGRSELAQTQLDMAKQMDPKDPTPYLYDALKKQTENRPVEALHDLQQSMALNDNRAINRSEQLLDSDRAARGASLARIYENLGFEQRGTLEAFTAIQNDPTNYSAHRFLADMYVNQPGSTSAQLSELLQAKLLQPVNINPVQPHLAVSQRSMLNSSSIGNSSFQDYTRVFEGNRPQLIVSGVAGSQGTLGDETTLSGIVDKFSYSLGQYHYQTDGFYRPYGALDSRRNTAQQNDIYDGFIQYAVSNWLNLQFEYINRGGNQGNIQQELRGKYFEPLEKTRLSQEIYRSGANISLFDNDHILFSYVHNSNRNWSDDYFVVMPGVVLNSSVAEVDLYESQYIHHSEKYDLSIGYSGYKGAYVDVNSGISDQSVTHGGRFYSYFNYKPINNLKTIIGLSHDDGSRMPNYADMSGFMPKTGLVWDVNNYLKFRLAGFKEGSRPLATYLQTIEQTQIAGFNQFIDDGLDGKYFWFYGGAMDVKVAENVFTGLEFSRKDKYDYKDDRLSFSNDHVKSYLNWNPTNFIALSASYNYFMRHTPSKAGQSNQSLTTHSIPLEFRYFHHSGLFSKLTGTFVAQDGRYLGSDSISSQYANSNFFLVDTAIGYRLPKRWGIVSFEVSNLFDRRYSYQDLIESDSDPYNKYSQFIPQRSFFGRITLNF
jgi:tetratricopeptide (TPR) repeat protein